MNRNFNEVIPTCITFFVPLAFLSPALAQEITPDDTVGTEVDRVGNVTEITGGAEKGNNLFHSFEEFSVPAGKEAFFNIENNLNIENIFSRVTGGLRSDIDGLISANGSANLFLINPAGILFGRDARLDIGGSFYGSTADSLLFDDGVEFSAVNPQNPILTINAPIGLRFRDNPEPIIYRSLVSEEGRFLPAIKSNQTIAFVGGDVIIDDSVLTVESGARIELGGLSAAGTVKLNEDGSLSFPNEVTRADVSLFAGTVEIPDVGARGGISINARNLELSKLGDFDSLIFASNSDITSFQKIDRAFISINADQISLTESSNITASLRGDAVGRAKGLEINTRILEISTGNLSPEENPPRPQITVTGKTENIVEDNVDILTINASERISLDRGAITGQLTTGGGQKGNARIKTNIFEITNDSPVFLNNISSSSGNIGKLTIDADRILVNNSVITTSLSAIADQNTGTDIDITANYVEVVNGGEISSKSPGGGNAGSVIINTDQLTVRDNSEISASSVLGGSAGNLEITAESLNLDGGTLTASTEAETGGNINLMVDDRITLRNNSQITAEATGNADGGSIDLQTEQLTVQDNSEITASSRGEGSGGDIKITADSLNLNRGTIAAETAAETGGNITLDIDDNISLRNNSQITAKATGNADGGNINIDADLIIATPNQNNDILASAGQEGTGGRIVINADGVLGLEERPENDTTNDINASGGIDGEVIINTPDVDISKGLIETPQNVIALEQIVAQACSSDGIARGNSTLIVNGRGGVTPEITAPISSDAIYIEGESLATSTEAVQKKFQVDITDKEEKRNIVTLVESSKPVSIDDIIPARGAIILENGDVILTAYPTPNSGYRSAYSQANCTR